jgi:hypothetical protein
MLQLVQIRKTGNNKKNQDCKGFQWTPRNERIVLKLKIVKLAMMIRVDELAQCIMWPSLKGFNRET